MPLTPPAIARTPQHIRRIHFQSYQREDGLWDIEGELTDTKACDYPHPRNQGIRKAGEFIHHMLIRVTIDTQLTVHAIEAAMDAHPVHTCPGALNAMQRLVGSSMAQGWRKAINIHLGGVAGCTHMRELLQNMGTAAFQSLNAAFFANPEHPPAFLGRCTGWDLEGDAVREYYPKFFNWRISESEKKAVPPQQLPPPIPFNP